MLKEPSALSKAAVHPEKGVLKGLLAKQKTITLDDFQRLASKKLSNGIAFNYKYLSVWKRALFRIKTRKVLSWLSDDIIKYGTSSDFVDMSGKFKLNIDEIIWKKQNKQEHFRLATDTSTEVLPWNLVHPESRFMKVWSCVLSVILLYTATIMPIRVAFYDVVFFDAWTVIDLIIDGLFAFDILVNCVVTYDLRDGSLEKRPGKVFSSYARSWLTFDIIACLPFSFIEFGDQSDEYGSSGSRRYNNLVRLLRVPRLYKLLRILRIAKVFKSTRSSSFISQTFDFLRMNSSTV